MKLGLVCLACSLIVLGECKTAAEWKSRVIYQLLTDRFAKNDDTRTDCADLHNYCGGTWRGIRNHLQYIKDLGCNAIWISPVPVNTEGSYHGYHQTDFMQLNPHFGSGQDLRDLVNAAHNMDIWVMVDVVANHVGNTGENFLKINPFNSSSHYHSRCEISDWGNQTQVEVCRLADLPDLNQDLPFVKNYLYSWVSSIVSTYAFDGIRIDTVPEVAKPFWPTYASSSGVFQIGEVYNGDTRYVAGYQQVLDSVLSYPMAFTLRDVFQNHASMAGIRSRIDEYAAFRDVSVLGNFVDNHDLARFLNHQPDYRLLENALVYMLMSQGVPIVYYGTEQGFHGGDDPGCREVLWTTGFSEQHTLYKFVQSVLAYRTQAQIARAGPQIERYRDDSFYAFTRDSTLVALTNVGTGRETRRSITYHPYKEGQILCNVFWPDDCVTVLGGAIGVVLLDGEAKIFHPK